MSKRFVKIHLGSGYVWLKLAREFNGRYGQIPAELPAVGGSGFSGVQAPMFGTNGLGVNVRSAPKLAELPVGSPMPTPSLAGTTLRRLGRA